MDFLRFFSRLTCKLVKVLVELVPVPVLGDVAHEEPVVVVRDGHAHLPAFADLTTIELSWTDTRTHTHITTKNKLIKKSARNFTAFSSVHPPIWIIKKKKYYKKRKKKWIANLHSNSHSSMIHSFTGYSVICARAFKKSTKRKKPEKGRGKRKRLTRNLPTEQKTNPVAVAQSWPSLVSLTSRLNEIVLRSCREKKIKDKRERAERADGEKVKLVVLFPRKKDLLNN